MVIDLTQDSDSEDQIKTQLNHTIQSAIPAFFSNLTYRKSSSSSSLVPLKRKSENSPDFDGVGFKRNSVAPSATSSAGSDLHLNQANRVRRNSRRNSVTNSVAPSVASDRHQNNNINGYTAFVRARNLFPSTPSPSPAAREQLKAVSVVIPSPSRKLKKEIESAEWETDTRPITPKLTGLSQEFYPTDAYEKRGLRGAYPAARKVNRQDISLHIGTPGPILKKRPDVHDQLQQTLKRKLSMIKGPSVRFAIADGPRLAYVTDNFEFINSYKLGKGVSPANPDFIGGCSCGEYCNPERCPCLDKEEDSTDTIIPYQNAKDRVDLLVLKPEFLERTTMIYECGTKCLRSRDYIRAGQFIDCYLGEVITKEKADKREEIALKRGHSYLFGLDFSPEVDEDEIYVVDGERFGSATRFMNHSCKPNCRMFPVTHTIGDERLYDLAFFSQEDIEPGTELTFDYNPGAKANKKVDPSAVSCLCGEANCRGQLWPNQRKGTK
ncbi:hypothetical protein BBP40_005090 [Aspergillus hancockii]|nr:hypothetical protein BBP40_005090 [Aspergillus hancockii]